MLSVKNSAVFKTACFIQLGLFPDLTVRIFVYILVVTNSCFFSVVFSCCCICVQL